MYCFWFFFFKQKTAYEMRISDWSSDVCSSDLSESFSGAARSRVAACGLKAYFAPMKIDLQLEKPLSSARVVVAMSGGVDSSVAAALCAASGAETIGVTLQLYDHGAAVANPRSCCAGRDIPDPRPGGPRRGKEG